MTGIIRAPRPTKDYFDVRNATVRDSRLSYRARGILVRLLSNADGYRMTAEDLAREGQEGRRAILRALRELRAAGYMRVERSQNTKGQWVTSTYIYDTAQPAEVPKPHSGFPNAGFPNAGSPDAGNLDGIKNDHQNNKKKDHHQSQQQHPHQGLSSVSSRPAPTLRPNVRRPPKPLPATQLPMPSG